MQKRPNCKLRLEYRQYNLDPHFPVKALLQERFVFPKAQLNAISYMHLHNCIELGYNYRGSNTLVVEGEEEQITLPGDISILLPFSMHSSYSTPQQNAMGSNDWEYLYIDLEQLFKDYFLNGFPGLKLFSHHSTNFPNVISGKQYPHITRLLKDVLDEMRNEREHYREIVKGMLLAFFMQLLRLVEEKTYHLAECSPILTVAPAITYINDHYFEQIASSSLAQICHMSVTHFRRIFKRIMNLTPMEYIALVRIQNSCKLLYETELPVLEIAMRVGYVSISSFNRKFADTMETTPTKWRNEKRKIHKTDMIFSIFDG